MENDMGRVIHPDAWKGKTGGLRCKVFSRQGGPVHFSLWFCGQVPGLCSLAGRKTSRSAGKALQLRMVLGYFAMSND